MILSGCFQRTCGTHCSCAKGRVLTPGHVLRKFQCDEGQQSRIARTYFPNSGDYTVFDIISLDLLFVEWLWNDWITTRTLLDTGPNRTKWHGNGWRMVLLFGLTTWLTYPMRWDGRADSGRLDLFAHPRLNDDLRSLQHESSNKLLYVPLVLLHVYWLCTFNTFEIAPLLLFHTIHNTDASLISITHVCTLRTGYT